MFVGITNTPRPYEWGSRTAIAELLGREPSGRPEAELWLGAHPGSPSVILDPTQTGGATDLAAWIDADPGTALGPFAASGRLPFLLKVLAADSPLSLQAHPRDDQARDGFTRENNLGVPLDAEHRNYRDPYPKPELIYALSTTFEALCGFRSPDEVRALLGALYTADASRPEPRPGPIDALLDRLRADDAIRTTVQWLSSRGPGVADLVSLIAELAMAGTVRGFGPELATARSLAGRYPGDPGIVLALLLNRVGLKRGEALYLPAGNIHAYLSGLGVELMTASDNVLRGGLTPKHVDVPELLRVLHFEPLPVPYLTPLVPSDGVEVFRPDTADFVLVRFDGSAAADIELTGPAIAVCTSGSAVLAGRASTRLGRGDAAYVTPDEGTVSVSSGGEVFLATTSRRE